jgi:hypothetical protein
MLSKEIRKYIIQPALSAALWNDIDSDILTYGTGYVETNYQAVMQTGTPKNGGIGFFQEQPSDYADKLTWFKNGFNHMMLDRILMGCNYIALPADVIHCAYNVAYGALICRVHYYRATKQKLPSVKDPDAARLFAEFHKTFYNGGGKADVDKNTDIFKRIINGEI